jgi:Zn-dependent peptidase ImmA (M78 family)
VKIPKSFFIKGNKWVVKYRKHVVHEDGDECFGMADPSTRIIYLEKGLEPQKLEWVFWHEYGHAILSESGVVDVVDGVNPLAAELICDGIADAFTKDKDVKFKRSRK